MELQLNFREKQRKFLPRQSIVLVTYFIYSTMKGKQESSYGIFTRLKRYFLIGSAKLGRAGWTIGISYMAIVFPLRRVLELEYSFLQANNGNNI